MEFRNAKNPEDKKKKAYSMVVKMTIDSHFYFSAIELQL